MRQRSLVCVVALALGGCSSPSKVPTFDVPDRQPGVRTPLTAACDPMDTTACFLPWPSSTYTTVGKGNYHFAMYGHGTGGSYTDTTLDAEIAGAGVAKVSIQFDGWTSSDVLDTFLGLTEMFQGSAHATGMLMQALADAAVVQATMGGIVGAALAAPMLESKVNPAAGRHPDPTDVVWAGGSLGGIMSLVATPADSSVRYGVLNVPGAAWTNFVPKSLLFTMIEGLLQRPYQGDLNALQAVAMSQGTGTRSTERPGPRSSPSATPPS